MGMDAIYNQASADIMELQQPQDLNFFNFSVDAANTVALTCCLGNTGIQEFVFGGFDNNLGVLATVTLDISFSNLTFDPTANPVFDGGIQIVGKDMNTATLDASLFIGNLDPIDLSELLFTDDANTATLVASQIVENLDTTDLGAALFAEDANTVTLNFDMLFTNKSLPISDDKSGMATLSYFYEPTVVPIPGSAALMAPALAALLASAAYRRRRRKEDE
jgi:hypothetical protein